MVSGEGMGRVVFAFTKSWTQILLQSTVLGMSNYLNSLNYAVHCQKVTVIFLICNNCLSK